MIVFNPFTGAFDFTGGTTASVRVGNTLYVDRVKGDDATAVRERPDRPFATIVAAAAAANTGDVIRVGPGIFIEAAIVLLPNVNLLGSGTYTTVIQSSAAGGVALTPGDNAIICDLTIESTTLGYQFLIGTDVNTVTGFTNVVVSRCKLKGYTDCFYFDSGFNCSLTAYDCVIVGNWDCVYCNQPGGLFKFYNCEFVSTGNGLFNIARCVSGVDGTVKIYGGSLKATGGSASNVAVQSGTSSSNIIELHNLTIESGTGGSGANSDLAQQGSGVIRVNDVARTDGAALSTTGTITTLSRNLIREKNLSDITNQSTARNNLGLGTLATQNGTFSGTHSGTSSGTNTGDQIVPVNTTATTSQWFSAYSSSTGVFTKSQPTFTDLAAHPTTVAGYGITDLNSLGDARWQLLDADLTAIAALAGTSGLLKKTAANTWSLDTSTYATQAYVDAAVVGLLDDRGNYNPGSGNFPTTGGSGAAGAILKGDLWIISANGTLAGGFISVTTGDVIRALIDTPGQGTGNWAIAETNIGFVPLNSVLSDGAFYVGSASGIGAEVFMSGDVTMTNAGVTAIGSTKVTSAMLNSNVYSTAHSWGGVQTFTAPVLGTPTSGTVTNLTGTASININGTVGATTPAAGTFTTLVAGSAGIHTASPGGALDVRSTTTTELSLILAGADTLGNTSTDGLGFQLGANLTGNRQLWLIDSSSKGNSAKTAFRYILGFDLPNIDGVSNDGSTRRHINLGTDTSNVMVGGTPGTSVQADVTDKLTVIGNVRTTTFFKVGTLQVVGARKTGWAVATGTATRTTFATFAGQTISVTPTQAQVQAIDDHVKILSERLKALIDDLHQTAGHGLIGT